jgi:hypothetical protein
MGRHRTQQEHYQYDPVMGATMSFCQASQAASMMAS